MKRKNFIMVSAFVLAIIAAFAFKPAKIMSGTDSSQLVYYANPSPCDHSATCSNVSGQTCVTGIGLTGFSDDPTACAGSSAFRFKP